MHDLESFRSAALPDKRLGLSRRLLRFLENDLAVRSHIRDDCVALRKLAFDQLGRERVLDIVLNDPL